MPTLDGFKKYARLDDESDESAKICYASAIQEASDAGIPEFLFLQDDPKLSMMVYALALHHYDNRGGGDDTFIRPMVVRMRRELMLRDDSI